MGPNDDDPRSLLAGLASRSRLNFTDSASKVSPLWNFTPFRSLISHVVGAASLGSSVANSGTRTKLWSRATSMSNIWAPTFDAGCSDWFIVSSVLGWRRCARTSLLAGAATAATGIRRRVVTTATALRRHWLMRGLL